MLFKLARHKISFRNLQLLGFRVTGQFDDFEPVAQSGMDRLQPIRGRNEENARKIERQIKVMIGESIVLGGIEHFEQSSGGITSKIGAYFVQFVQQDDGVTALDAAQGLNDP